MLTKGAPQFLMCAPKFFGVNYVINPWMENQINQVSHTAAAEQWLMYVKLLEKVGAEIKLLNPVDGLPDIVFTANAGIVRGRKFIPARFRFAERQGEEPHNIAWFNANGFQTLPWPQDVFCEGAGTALFMLDENDRQTNTIVVAKDFRSDAIAADHIQKLLGVNIARVELCDPRFYHLDTCFCPLPGARAIWYPPAFTAASQETIKKLFPVDKLHAVGDTAAEGFACNAVYANGHVFMNTADDALRGWLKKNNFTPVETPLWEFLKAGGAAKCLTIRLDH